MTAVAEGFDVTGLVGEIAEGVAELAEDGGDAIFEIGEGLGLNFDEEAGAAEFGLELAEAEEEARLGELGKRMRGMKWCVTRLI